MILDDQVVRALSAALGKPGPADKSLVPLVANLPDPPKTPDSHVLSKRKQVALLRRDNFKCRYCASRVVVPGLLRYLSTLYPDLLPYDGSWHRSKIHPIYLSASASVDHVVPLDWGGSWDEENLVTACRRCNYVKAAWLLSELGWEVRPPTPSDWDGLSTLFVKAFDAKPVSHREIRPWVNALRD